MAIGNLFANRNSLSFMIEGLEELNADFRKLPGKLRERSLKRAARRGGKLIAERAKAKVLKRTGRLAASLSATVRNLGLTDIQAEVGPKSAFKYEKVELVLGTGKLLVATGWYAHWVEFGHIMKARGKVIGSIGPRPFLRPAADQSRDEVVSIVISEMNRDIERFNNKSL